MSFKSHLWPAKPCPHTRAKLQQGTRDPQSSSDTTASTGTATVAVICEGLVALAQPGPAGVHQLHEAVRTAQLTLAS